MAILWLMALLVGAVFSNLMPIVQFALGLVAATVAGCFFGLLRGFPVGPTIGWSLVFLACAEVGYGLGLGFSSYVSHWRGRGRFDERRDAAATPLSPLGDVKK